MAKYEIQATIEYKFYTTIEAESEEEAKAVLEDAYYDVRVEADGENMVPGIHADIQMQSEVEFRIDGCNLLKE